MRIVLYNSYEEGNKVDKVNIKEIITLNGTLRAAAAITAPTLDISLDPHLLIQESKYRHVIDEAGNNYTDELANKIVTMASSDILTANYAFIPEFERYYFIEDIIVGNNLLWQIVLKEDVLMSFKDNILNLIAMIERNEFNYNNYIDDPLVPFTQQIYTTEIEVNDGPLVNLQLNPNLNLLAGCYLITVINDMQDIPMQYVRSPIPGLLPTVTPYATGQASNSKSYILFPAALKELNKLCLATDTIASNILSVIAYPFEIPIKDGDVIAPIRIGSSTMNTVKGNNPKNIISPYMCVADFNMPKFTTFIDGDPYTKYELYLPYLGWIDLDNSALDSNIKVFYQITYATGTSNIIVVNDTRKSLIYSQTCQLGVNIPINTTNALEVENNSLLNNINLGLSLLSSVGSVGVGVATGNPVAMAGGVLSAANAAASFTRGTITNYKMGNGSVTSSIAGCYLPQKVRLRKSGHIINEMYLNKIWMHLYGKPLHKVLPLYDLKGFTIVNDTNINIPTAMDNEANEIKSLLKSGIIL